MNDICNVSGLLITILYADDTSVLVNGKSLNLIIANKLSLNSTTSYYVVFHRARIKLSINSIKMKIDNANIMEVNVLNIEVILDSKLSWIQHYKFIISPKKNFEGHWYYVYSPKLYQLKCATWLVSFVYIYPNLIYGIEYWGNASNCHIDPLMLQKRILILESIHFLIMMFHLNCYVGIIIFCPYVS